MKRVAFTLSFFLLIPCLLLSRSDDEPKNSSLPSANSGPTATSAPAHSDPYVRPFSAPAEKLKIAGIQNAGKVSDVLYRGAQPSAQGLAELKKLGVTTIVDLRGNRGDVTWERRQTEALGMRFMDIPVLGWSSPANGQVAQFLKLFDDPQQKIFVHCRYGADRTGVMVAAYRIAQQKWTVDQAVQEMYSFGFHYHWYPGMRDYVRKFPATYASDTVFASSRAASSAP